MKNQVNFSHLIAIVVGIFIPIIVWGVTVETRLTTAQVSDENSKESIQLIKEELKENSDSNNNNFNKILEKLHSIELSVMDKKDRD